MYKIAIVSPCNLPIPAIKGGAIETLINYIIDINEEKKELFFEVFSIADDEIKLNSSNYKYTKFHYIKRNTLDYIFDKIKYFFRIFSGEKIIFSNSYINKVNSKLKTNSYDAVIVEGEVEFILKIKDNYKNTVLHVHTDILNSERSYYKKITQCNINYFCVSEYIKRQVNKSSKSKVVMNCANESIFYNTEKNLTLKRKLGFTDDDFIVLFSGRLDYIKGIDILIKAITEINNPKIKLLIIGSGWFSDNRITDFHKKLIDLSEKSRNLFCFTGFIKHSSLGEYYSIADLGFVPSRCNEAAPLSLIEMQMCGLSTVITNKGGMPEYVYNKENIVNPDIEEFKKIILSYYNKTVLEERKLFYRDRYQYYKDFIDEIITIIKKRDFNEK